MPETKAPQKHDAPLAQGKLKKILVDLCSFAMIEQQPDPVAPYSFDYIDTQMNKLQPDHDTGFQPECQKGCAFCCHLPIMCPPQLAFYVAERLKIEWSDTKLTALKEKLSIVSAQYKNTEVADILSSRITCSFLAEDNSCQIYDMRPFSCRSFMSQSRQACENLHAAPEDTQQTIEQDPFIFTLYQAATTALIAANKKQDRGETQVFFLPAVYAALKTPTIVEDWYTGKALNLFGELEL